MYDVYFTYMPIVIKLMIGELELIKTDNLFHPLSPSCRRIWMYVNPKQKYTKCSFRSSLKNNRVKSALVLLIYDSKQQINSLYYVPVHRKTPITHSFKNKQLLCIYLRSLFYTTGSPDPNWIFDGSNFFFAPYIKLLFFVLFLLNLTLFP